MNVGLLIVGIFFLVIAFLFLFLGGWERFKLERKDDLWLVMFILGWIVLAFAIIFIVWAALSNRKKSMTYADYESYYPFGMNNQMMNNMPSIPASTAYMASTVQNAAAVNKTSNKYMSIPQRNFPNPFASSAFSFLPPPTSNIPSMTKSNTMSSSNSTSSSNSSNLSDFSIFSNYRQGISMFE